MKRIHRALASAGLASALLASCGSPGARNGAEADTAGPLRGALVSADLLSREPSLAGERLAALRREGFNAAVLAAGEDTPAASIHLLRDAASAAGLSTYLWFSVGRSPRLAASHPGWVGGIGAHEDWRRSFPDAPRPRPDERIGVWPWTPIWYRAVLEDRAAAIEQLLRRAGEVRGVFLEHVQGPPSACGCGNLQCRWTADYRVPGGPEMVEGSPSAILIARLERTFPEVTWIPVWVTECEERDQGHGGTGYCGSVPCFTGLCWKESSRELESLLRASRGPLAVLLATRLFGRDTPVHAAGDGWMRSALAGLSTIPRLHGREPPHPDRVLAVVEGREEMEEAFAAGARGVVAAKGPLEEGWEPRIIPRVRAGAAPGGKALEGAHGHR